MCEDPEHCHCFITMDKQGKEICWMRKLMIATLITVAFGAVSATGTFGMMLVQYFINK